jgi:hypothetical protein
MSEESNYLAEQEYREYMRLINSVELLTQAEYELCKKWDAEEAWKYLNNIGEGRWLNCNVYSEYDHEKRQFEMETGVVGSYDDPNYLRA